MKKLFCFSLVLLFCTGCFTKALHDSIENQYTKHYQLKIINKLRGGFNSQKKLVIQNFRKDYPQDFCLVKWSSYQEFQLSHTDNTIVTEYLPVFNLYEDPQDEAEYINIIEKHKNHLLIEVQEYGKAPVNIKVYTEYKCEVNKLKAAGLKSLYPIAIAADIALLSIMVSMRN